VTTPVLVGLVVLGFVVVGAVAVWAFRRRAIEQERRRVAALTTLAIRLREVSDSLEAPVAVAEPPPRPPTPLPAIEPGGRAAFIDALTEAVAHARADGSRLTAALVESGSTPSAALAGEVATVTGGAAYEVGARSVALVVPGAGRADALGVLARIQAACGATGNAVELEPGDDAVALATRLLSSRGEETIGGGPDGPPPT
jgi:hypothetical protein